MPASFKPRDIQAEVFQCGDALTGNVNPLIAEIRHALRRLHAGGQETTIDLTALPFGPADERLLQERLGRGEVSISIEALGPTEIHETAYPGVWWVEFFSTEKRRLAVHIEVSTVPSLLRTPKDDLNDSLSRLERELEHIRSLNARDESGGEQNEK